MDGVPQAIFLSLISLIVSLSDDRRFGIQKCNLILNNTSFRQSKSENTELMNNNCTNERQSFSADCETSLTNLLFKNSKVATAVLSEALRIIGKILMAEISERSACYLEDEKHFKKISDDAASLGFAPNNGNQICNIIFGSNFQFKYFSQKYSGAPVAEIASSILSIFESTGKGVADTEIEIAVAESSVTGSKRKVNDILNSAKNSNIFKICSLSPKHQNVYIFLASKYILNATKEVKALVKKIKFVSKLLTKHVASRKARVSGHDDDSDLEHIWSDDDDEPEAFEVTDCIDESGICVETESLKSDFVQDCESTEIKVMHPVQYSRVLTRFRGSGLPVYEFFSIFLYSSIHMEYLLHILEWISTPSCVKFVSTSSIQLLKLRFEKFELELMNIVSCISILSKFHVAFLFIMNFIGFLINLYYLLLGCTSSVIDSRKNASTTEDFATGK